MLLLVVNLIIQMIYKLIHSLQCPCLNLQCLYIFMAEWGRVPWVPSPVMILGFCFVFLLIFFIINIVQISVETDTLRIIYLHIYVLTKMFRWCAKSRKHGQCRLRHLADVLLITKTWRGVRMFIDRPNDFNLHNINMIF